MTRAAVANLAITVNGQGLQNGSGAMVVTSTGIAGIVSAMKIPLRHVLICGSNPFVEAAAEGTMAAGICAALIKTERYGV